MGWWRTAPERRPEVRSATGAGLRSSPKYKPGVSDLASLVRVLHLPAPTLSIHACVHYSAGVRARRLLPAGWTAPTAEGAADNRELTRRSSLSWIAPPATGTGATWTRSSPITRRRALPPSSMVDGRGAGSTSSERTMHSRFAPGAGRDGSLHFEEVEVRRLVRPWPW